MKPILETYTNPLTARLAGAVFKSYQLQSVREHAAPDGSRIISPITEQHEAPCMIGLYGKLPDGTVEHIADYASLGEAHDTLAKMGIIPPTQTPQNEP